MTPVIIPFLKVYKLWNCCYLCKEIGHCCEKNSTALETLVMSLASCIGDALFISFFVLGAKALKTKRSCAAGRRCQCWCKTCILSCNCSSREASANNTSGTCLLVARRKFSLHKSQTLTSVEQLWLCLIRMTVRSIYYAFYGLQK